MPQKEHKYIYKVVLPKEKKEEEENGDNSDLIKGLELTIDLINIENAGT